MAMMSGTTRATGDARRPRGRDGFVLVTVIWLAGLVAAVAAGFAITVRVNVLTSAVTARGAEAEAAADGLVRLRAYRLATDPAPPEAATAAGAVSVCRYGETVTAAIAIQDQAGLIDLNSAPAFLLERLVGAVAGPGTDATAVAAAIADYRDADDDATGGVFEPPVYPGRSFGPKNAPFQVVEELNQIPGLDEAAYRALLPLVTVHSSQSGFDPAVAPAALRKALGFAANGAPPPDLASLAVASAGLTYGIDAAAVSASGARYRRYAVVTLTRQPARPYAILSWQRGGAFDTPAAAGGDCLN